LIPSRKTVVYISGKYTDADKDKEGNNIIRAALVAKKYWKKGFTVICPHTNTMYVSGVDYEGFMAGDIEILSRCDVIVMMTNWKESKGAIREYNYAVKHNIPVIFE